MKKIVLASTCLLLGLSLASCSNKKSDAEAQNVDSTQTVNNNNAPYAEPTQSNAYTTKLAGKQFEITISRVADKTLPIVKDDLGKEFYDNRVDVVIKCNGQEFYKNSFTKDAFSEFLTTAADRQGTVLLGMAYDSAKSDGHAIRLGAQIGQVGIEEGPAFSIEIPLDGSAASIVRDNNQDTTGDDMTD
jgi:hypothetical protein|uniref:DUF4738 domain-containing protein n=2 Tax=Alloprevotella sp. TaxID=1872471 RepID=UPI0015B6B2F9